MASLGFTHVELLPVMEHPFGGSWGYQVTSYFAPTARWGPPDDLRALVDAFHARGIGVLLDWVPAHFPRDAWALARFDGSAVYEHLDPRKGEHPDWGTLVFNLGRNEVRNFLVASALYWLDSFHVDGLRVDAVASMLYLDYSRKEGEWEPNAHGGRENLEAVSFFQELTDTAHRLYPGALLVAEESTAWPRVTHPTHEGGLGFDLKWDMGWMHDTLAYFQGDPLGRAHHHHKLTFGVMYMDSEAFVLPLSHDEVVHLKGSLLGKMPGSDAQKHAGLRALYATMWSRPGRKLLFMGGELAQRGEWNHDGSLERAIELMTLAKDAGADCAKFQHFRAPHIVSDYGFRALGGQQSPSEEAVMARSPAARAAGRNAARARGRLMPNGLSPKWLRCARGAAVASIPRVGSIRLPILSSDRMHAGE